MERTVEIACGVYWVGGGGLEGDLRCNPYLLVDGDEAVLFDPGSVLDFSAVYENIKSIIPPERIKYLVLHHQDPDLCSSIPLFEREGLSFQLVTHWRAKTLIDYYGVRSPYYIVNEQAFRLVLASGREIRFVQTPYLHFPGAIVSYDIQSKILFTSDLFGAFANDSGLYAGPDYLESMKMFHEHYMPSNEILRPVMETFLNMDIAMLAPQHGSIINTDVKEYIKVLRDLECGSFLTPIKKDLKRSGGYSSICSLILKRYAALYGVEEVKSAIAGLKITIAGDAFDIIDYNYTGDVLWDNLFDYIHARKGMSWIIVIEPFVRKMTCEYDLPLPQIFEAALKKAEEEVSKLSEENARLIELNLKLNESVESTREKLLKCPVTGLYNQDFFISYLSNETSTGYWRQNNVNPALLVVSVDNMAQIKHAYGNTEVAHSLSIIAYMLQETVPDNSIIFKLEGSVLACYLPDAAHEEAVALAEKIGNAISSSERFIEQITLSIGVVTMNEIIEAGSDFEQSLEAMYDIAEFRVKLAKANGMNTVCGSSKITRYQEETGKVLLVDTDEIITDTLKVFLERFRYRVFTAKDGVEALTIAEKEAPDVVISEIMLPKLDGFLLREKLMMQSHTKDVLFIVISHVKDAPAIKRAQSLGIMHYFQKPFMLSELLGVVKYQIKGEAYE